ncbi:MAG: hypothetical protein ACRYFS_22560 [Janthinobacterium lividum]
MSRKLLASTPGRALRGGNGATRDAAGSLPPPLQAGPATIQHLFHQ